MILEVAILDIKKGQESDFEDAFSKAQLIIQTIPGYVSHQLQKCVEIQSRYVLLVNWEKIEDHTINFRKSKQYQEWKVLLHHFYDPFPTVEHFTSVFKNKA